MTIDQLIERLRKHSEEVGECWEWHGATQTQAPTPMMRFNERSIPVRRAIAIARGMQIEGKLATHKCGNPLCVNPDHVTLVTRRKLQQRNALTIRYQTNPVRMQKLAQKARSKAKLTMELAEQIRQAEGTQREIAAAYGITQATVSVIKRGKTWRDYTNPWAGLIGGRN
jgi:hypothetical protein